MPSAAATDTNPIRDGRAALIVAHPGHELRVHRWLETARPVTFVLTKGDGSGRASRLASTTHVLHTAGATTGSVYGRSRDRDIYNALLRGDHDFFRRVLDDLAGALRLLGIDYVAADAEEGYNPSHDICRWLVTAAVAMASDAMARSIVDFEFPLVGRPDTCPDALRDRAIWLSLDEAALARKLRAARNYVELKSEVDRALDANGIDVFRIECLRPVGHLPGQNAAPPFYEEHGARQVASGRYSHVIRYDEHVGPLKHALWRHAGLA